MEKLFKPLILLCLFLYLIFLKSCAANSKLVPALYIFGDSNVDSGNNNNLKTMIKGNVKPYGIDFPGGLSTGSGRMTNGFTYVDFFSKWLGLQLAPAITLVDLNKTENTDGFNYASSSSGILESTILQGNENIYLGKQVSMFKNTVENYLPKHFNDKAELSNYLSKSIFVVSIGYNDFVISLHIKEGSSEKLITHDRIKSFSEELLKKLENYIQELYKLGARKFLVNELFPLGCAPMEYIRMKQKISQKCAVKENQEIASYNEMLSSEIKKWKGSLEGSSFVIMKSFDLLNDVVANPTRYGMTDSRRTCCELNAGSSCDANKEPCKDRSQYVYYDHTHLTEAVHKILATKCYGEKGVCVPMNLEELAQN